MAFGAVCLFCGNDLDGSGRLFYDHVDERPGCDFQWQDWMRETPKTTVGRDERSRAHRRTRL